MAKRYLVTGGTGFLGAVLTRALVRDGHVVRVFDNNSRGKVARLGDAASEVEFIEGDIRDAAAVEAAMQGMDAVCHLAYINGTRFFYESPALVLEVGVKGMLNVLDACRAAGVGELVLASSSEVYQVPPYVPTSEDVPLVVPNPHNPRYSYGGGKIISELLALNYGRTDFERVLIFRPHNVYGPDMGFEHVIPEFVLRLHDLATSQPEGVLPFPIQGSGEETRAFIYIDDFTEGLLQVLKQGQHQTIYNIGTQDELSVAEVAQTVARYFGRDIDLQAGQLQPGSTPRRCPDITRLQGLGYAPRISFAEGVARTAEWYIQHAQENT